jgi:hypothetical protein
MLLELKNTKVPMKVVYLLSEELKENPERIVLTQSLTLNKSRPQMGLKGTSGLFGSQEWWDNIERRKMPLLFLSGTIKRTYVAGQDPSSTDNSFSLLLNDGSVHDESIYSYTKEEDKKLFCVGSRVEIVYALDEMKQQPATDGGVHYSHIVLEMAVSLQPVE